MGSMQNFPGLIRKRRSALVFRNLVWIFFHKPSNREKSEIRFLAFFTKISWLQIHFTKNYAENEKSGAERLFLILSATFWYASRLCSMKTDWVVLFLKNINLKKLKAEKMWIIIRIFTCKLAALLNFNYQYWGNHILQTELHSIYSAYCDYPLSRNIKRAIIFLLLELIKPELLRGQI